MTVYNMIISGHKSGMFIRLNLIKAPKPMTFATQ